MVPLNRLEELGREVARHEDEHASEAVELALARRRFVEFAEGEAIARPRPGVRWWLAVAAAATIVAAVVAIRLGRAPALTFHVGKSQRLGEVDAWLAAPEGDSLPLRFSDGTEVRLAPTARARVTRLESAGATLRLEAGHAGLHVAKRPGAAWRVSVGPFRVDVTGTRFDVAWDAAHDQFSLHMAEGSVVVSGCVFGAGRSFVQGDSVRASCRDGSLEINAGAAASAREAPPAAPALSAEAPKPALSVREPAAEGAVDVRGATEPTRKEPGTADAGWRNLARSGRFREAVELAESAGFASECASASAADVLALGDAARYSGRLERAVEAYEAVRRRFPGHERASVAAFALGRIAFDQRADHAGAAAWFRVYLGEQPGGRLARDALGRLMEALSRSGDRAGARREAARYLERYPGGPHADMAHQLAAD